MGEQRRYQNNYCKLFLSGFNGVGQKKDNRLARYTEMPVSKPRFRGPTSFTS